jgi:hypothetical protein
MDRLAKNPLHRDWRASWIAPQPYDLLTLLEPLDPADTRHYPQRSETEGDSRHCDLFHELRSFAYSNVLAYIEMGNFDAWRNRLLEAARDLNTFALPLGESDLRSAVKSTATWTWRRFSKEGLSEIQRARARRGRSIAANTTAALIADAIQELGDPTMGSSLLLRGGTTARDIAVYTGRSERTVRRYAAVPRDQYEMHSLKYAKPWESAGVSPPTWYRRH